MKNILFLSLLGIPVLFLGGCSQIKNNSLINTGYLEKTSELKQQQNGSLEQFSGLQTKNEELLQQNKEILEITNEEKMEEVKAYFNKRSNKNDSTTINNYMNTLEKDGFIMYYYFVNAYTKLESLDFVDFVDKDTFKKLTRAYARDKNNIYFDARGSLNLLKEADKDTFEVLGKNYSCYAKDKNNIYCTYSILDVDKDTFEVLSTTYAKDKDNIYYNGDIVKGADKETFKILQDIDPDDIFGDPDVDISSDAEDKNNKYFFGEIYKPQGNQHN